MGSPTIHRYRSGERGLFVNSYLVESEYGVVAVDSPLLISDGAAFRARFEALHKPLAAVLLTHPHPDHYNTVAHLLAGDEAPVVALPRVDEVIRRDDASKRTLWGPVFGDEWPTSALFPTAVAQDGATLSFAALTFHAYDLGRGESESETAWLLDSDDGAVAFVGDLVFNDMHVYLADGMTGEWIESLDRARSMFRAQGVRELFVGHGDPTGLHSLQGQKSYLLFVREAVRRLGGAEASLDADARRELTRLLREFAPTAALDWLIEAGCDAVAAELSREHAVV